MKKIKAVTFTGGNRPELLQKCKASVAAQQVEHEIIEFHGPFDRLIEARYQAIKDSPDKYVAFVDDDDTVLNNSLNLCAQALDFSEAGVAFTDEIVKNVLGMHIAKIDGPRHYLMISAEPMKFHHLMAFDGEKMPDIDVYIPNSVGTEWLLFAAAAFSAGAIHVPVFGYEWLNNPKSIRYTETENQYFEMFQRIQELYPQQDKGPIPRWNPPSV